MSDVAADEMTADQAIEHLRTQQNFALAVPAGLAAAAVGAVLWAVVTYVSGMELGLVAIAVGALVGLAIRKVGRGLDQQFGFLGAGCAALGWALGMILSDLAFAAKAVDRPITDVAATLGAGQTVTLAVQGADAMDLLFLAIAVWEGYKLSFAYRLRK